MGPLASSGKAAPEPAGKVARTLPPGTSVAPCSSGAGVASRPRCYVRINWVWMPPWGPDKITEDGREQLRALGFNV